MSLVHAILTTEASGGVKMNPDEGFSDNAGGGCRTAFLSLVKELAINGHKVRAFSTFTKASKQLGIEYYPIDELEWYGKPQVVWCCYYAYPLQKYSGCLRIASHHTYHTTAPWQHIDINTTPSQASLETMKAWYAPWSDWRVLPNAINPSSVNWNPIAGRVIYHTSCDRGLHLLLKIWPEIKRAVPHATLDVVSDWESWCNGVLAQRGNENSEWAKRAKWIREYMAYAIGAGGVTSSHHLPRLELEKKLSEASVFAFPCSMLAPSETFSASIMECLKIGMPVVLAPADALESVYRGNVLLTPAPVHERLPEFRDAVIAMLTEPLLAHRYSELGRAFANSFTYAKSGKILSEMMRT
jgi:glycosyltransferase involved in cell wall biosynthesis